MNQHSNTPLFHWFGYQRRYAWIGFMYHQLNNIKICMTCSTTNIVSIDSLTMTWLARNAHNAFMLWLYATFCSHQATSTIWMSTFDGIPGHITEGNTQNWEVDNSPRKWKWEGLCNNTSISNFRKHESNELFVMIPVSVLLYQSATRSSI